jgi:hypothetical protein
MPLEKELPRASRTRNDCWQPEVAFRRMWGRMGQCWEGVPGPLQRRLNCQESILYGGCIDRLHT